MCTKTLVLNCLAVLSVLLFSLPGQAQVETRSLTPESILETTPRARLPEGLNKQSDTILRQKDLQGESDRFRPSELEIRIPPESE